MVKYWILILIVVLELLLLLYKSLINRGYPSANAKSSGLLTKVDMKRAANIAEGKSCRTPRALVLDGIGPGCIHRIGAATLA